MMRSTTISLLTLSLGLFACGGDEPAKGTLDGDPPPALQGDVEPGTTAPMDVDAPDQPAPEATTAQADALIQQITSLIGEQNLDEAKSVLAKLEGMAANLPASYQDKIAQAKQLVEGSGMADQAQNLTEGLGLGGGD